MMLGVEQTSFLTLTVFDIRGHGLLVCRIQLVTLLNTATGHMYADQPIQVIPQLQVARIGRSFHLRVRRAVLDQLEQAVRRAQRGQRAQTAQLFLTVLVIRKVSLVKTAIST
tara:strand:- start:83 stop:418 length:336 start_codon:yes stop_codon:yes gene_type:complete